MPRLAMSAQEETGADVARLMDVIRKV